MFTEAEISKISGAIDQVLSGGKTYMLSDGHGSQTVTRSTLGELQRGLEYWKSELINLIGAPALVSTGASRREFF